MECAILDTLGNWQFWCFDRTTTITLAAHARQGLIMCILLWTMLLFMEYIYMYIYIWIWISMDTTYMWGTCIYYRETYCHPWNICGYPWIQCMFGEVYIYVGMYNYIKNIHTRVVYVYQLIHSKYRQIFYIILRESVATLDIIHG